ncbi:MAG: DUF7768 domain-containing protein [Candidatus Heimdallarchaeaceae archaeon]
MGKMERVVIESPYAADTEEGIDLNEAYAELAMHDCLVNYNESPYASHLLYTRRFVLRDEVPADRKLGIEAGFYWRDVADKSVFYKDLGWTSGMKKGIDDCVKKGTTSAVRNLPDNLWEQLLEYCYEACIDEPKRS